MIIFVQTKQEPLVVGVRKSGTHFLEKQLVIVLLTKLAKVNQGPQPAIMVQQVGAVQLVAGVTVLAVKTLIQSHAMAGMPWLALLQMLIKPVVVITTRLQQVSLRKYPVRMEVV